MPIDLSKAKAGDTVKFRCGGEAVIKLIEGTPIEKWLDVHLVGYGSELTYKNDGGLAGPKGSTPLDITEVIPAPVAFDWQDAKPGMAFRHINQKYTDKILFYVGDALSGNPVVQMGTASEFVAFSADALTRAPEHDIKESV